MALLPGDVAAGTNIKRADVEEVIEATQDALRLVKAERAEFLRANEDVTPASFDGYDGAQVVVTAHTNAHAKATETLNKVTGTLELFVDELRAVLRTVDDLEDLTEAEFKKIAAVSEEAVTGTTTQPVDRGDFALNDKEAPPDHGQPDDQPANDPSVRTPGGEA